MTFKEYIKYNMINKSYLDKNYDKLRKKYFQTQKISYRDFIKDYLNDFGLNKVSLKKYYGFLNNKIFMMSYLNMVKNYKLNASERLKIKKYLKYGNNIKQCQLIFKPKRKK